jgi:hypothetical protein
VSDRERIAHFIETHPTADVWDVLGQLELAPTQKPLVEALLDGTPIEECEEIETSANAGATDTTEQASTPETEGEPTTDPESDDAPAHDATDTRHSDLDFTAPESGLWADELHNREQWMGHVEKRPFAPWADRDHPAADEEEDARWKWGLSENYVTGETVAIAEDDPRLDGRVFLQQEDDPYVFVDGDDVRCPDTGEIHPEFVAILERLGLTYTDISVSGSGSHANYRGEMPNGLTQAMFAIDDEPWGANDDLPEVEIYAGKHVCVQTGKHVPGTPTEIREWESEALRKLLDEHEQLPTEPAITDKRETFDPSDYEPNATTATETTTDIRDQFAAVERLDGQRVADKTIVHSWNDDASTSDGYRAFVPTWGTNASGTANIVDNDLWQDTGGGGYGGPVVMALIDRGDLRPTTARPQDARGELWFRGVEHLRELGFDIPEYESNTLIDRERAQKHLAAWKRAKHEGYLPDDEPIPRPALVAIALDEDLCDREEIEDGWKLPRAAYDDALAVCRDETDGYGLNPGRKTIGRTWRSDGDNDSDSATESDTPSRIDTDVDPTTLDVVVDPELAWRAAKQTTPDDCSAGSTATLDLAVTDDGDAWECPQCSGEVGVVQAVALDRGTIDCCEEPLRDDDYDDAYWHARTAYGAPLPDFVSTETATDNWHLVQGAVSQLTHYHLSGMESTVTGEGGNDDDVIAEIDPCWADSESGQRIVAFRSGAFYCREHECVIDPLRFIALEHGVIDTCKGALTGEKFTRAYHIAREQYGAPLPDWETGAPDHIPVLPDADDLLGEFTTDKSKLDLAREDVTALLRSCASKTTKASVLTTLPALGKTTGVVILADEYPLLYLAPRRELMAEVEEKSDEWDRSCQHLPIFAAKPPSDAAVTAALELIREEDKQLLRQREDLLDRIEVPVTDDEDDESDEDGLDIRDPDTEYPDAESAHDDGYQSLTAARKDVADQNTQRRAMTEAQQADETDEDDIDLDRASCPTGDGEHGDAWQLVVAVARALGHTPREIHCNDTELFGVSIPCQDDDCDCEYSLAWEDATDPDNPKDILIGHYGHGHVDGARVHRERDGDNHMSITNRTIALDEFPGDTYDRGFDEEFVDHAAWAASALCPEVDDRQALFEQDLGNDDTLRAWIDGEATATNEAFAATDARLELMSDLTEALDAAAERREALVETAHGDAEDGAQALIDALDAVRALGPDWTGPAIETVYTSLRETVDAVADNYLTLLSACDHIETEILPALASVTVSVADDDSLRATTIPDRCGDDLTELVTTAVSAFCDQRDGVQGFIHAARTALAGGEEGCRELAIQTDDGYAHPMAYLLLDGLIDDTDGEQETDGVSEQSIIPTEDFDFEDDDDSEGGTNLARTENGRHTILTDRNHHGALIRDPPAFQSDEETAPNPVIGLDATGKESLWELAIGCEVETEDIHKTPRAKRAFLRDVLNLQVVQTSPNIQGYSGSPDSTNWDGPVALVNRIAEEYSASLLRRDTLSSTTAPGVITTKKAEAAITHRIRGATSAVEHYGDITGSNALGDHNLGIVLGSRHYGDGPVEKWAALGGETVTREGKGANLDYNCPIGNTFLAHMREDETLQAILRFGRDEEGAVVFAHTSALDESLPVVAEGQVVKTFSENANDITEVARQYRGEGFEISDLLTDVDCSRETVRRTLNEFAAFGYLDKHETKNGLATDYDAFEEPDAGVVELPSLEEPFSPDGPAEQGGESEDDAHHRSPITRYYTWSVEVDADDLTTSVRRESARATLPAPAKITAGSAPN